VFVRFEGLFCGWTSISNFFLLFCDVCDNKDWKLEVLYIFTTMVPKTDTAIVLPTPLQILLLSNTSINEDLLPRCIYVW